MAQVCLSRPRSLARRLDGVGRCGHGGAWRHGQIARGERGVEMPAHGGARLLIDIAAGIWGEVFGRGSFG